MVSPDSQKQGQAKNQAQTETETETGTETEPEPEAGKRITWECYKFLCLPYTYKQCDKVRAMDGIG